ncbi:MAG: hypothetical protein Q9190_003079 [Brigantiaea leucoxantha]
MSERGSFRQSHSSRGGGGASRSRGGGGSSSRGGGSTSSSAPEKPKKENILDLTKYMDKEIIVKFSGGREVTGTLKGYDQLMNLVLDDVREILHDENGQTTTRPLGLLVARGTLLVLISPLDGSEEIANPFIVAEE